MVTQPVGITIAQSSFSGITSRPLNCAASSLVKRNRYFDGTDAPAGLQGFVQVVGMEAVKQFEVQTSGITAEAAHTGGGDIIMELRSGTNTLHGRAYGFMANEVLDANTWSNKYFLAQCATGDAPMRSHVPAPFESTPCITSSRTILPCPVL